MVADKPIYRYIAAVQIKKKGMSVSCFASDMVIKMNLLVTLTAGTAPEMSGLGLMNILWLVLLLLAFYFILIRPQRKKEKKDAEMRKNIQIGDEIVSAGGIVGIVCKLEEKTLVIETGGDRSKIRLMRWAVSQNLDAEKEAAATSAAKAAEKKDKKKSAEPEIEKD